MDLKQEERDLIKRKITAKCQIRNKEEVEKLKKKFDKQLKEVASLLKEQIAITKKLQSVCDKVRKDSDNAVYVTYNTYNDEAKSDLTANKSFFNEYTIFNELVDEVLLNDNMTLKDIVKKIEAL